MADRETGFEELLKHILDEERDEIQPLSQGEREAWQRDDLSEAERAALRERLILDKEAVRDLLDSEPPPSGQTEAEAAWAEFVALRDAGEGAVSEDEEMPFPLERSGGGSLTKALSAVAAVLLAATVVLGLMALRLSGQRDALMRPAVTMGEVQTVFLGDISPTRNVDGPPALSGEKKSFRLELPFAWESPVWRVAITDPSGRVVYTVETDSDGRRVIVLNLVSDFFEESGVYRVNVSGLRDGVFEVFGGFDLRVGLE
jgi:hypothetical protein